MKLLDAAHIAAQARADQLCAAFHEQLLEHRDSLNGAVVSMTSGGALRVAAFSPLGVVLCLATPPASCVGGRVISRTT